MPDVNVVATSVAVGLMGANVLIVNNYRDIDDDRAVGKRTLAVIFGHTAIESVYLFSGFIAVALMLPLWASLPLAAWAIPVVYLAIHTTLYFQIIQRRGKALNPFLGMTAAAMLFYVLLLLIVAFVM